MQLLLENVITWVNIFLSRHAVRQAVDISFTICVFVRLWISPPWIKLVASHFARRFIGVQGRQSQIFVKFAPPEAQNQTNQSARRPRKPVCKHYCRDVCGVWIYYLLSFSTTAVDRLEAQSRQHNNGSMTKQSIIVTEMRMLLRRRLLWADQHCCCTLVVSPVLTDLHHHCHSLDLNYHCDQSPATCHLSNTYTP